MKHHPTYIPHSFNGILAWGYNCNTKIPGYDTKYEISDNLGTNFIEDTTACYTQFATLLGTRNLVDQRVKEITKIIRQQLEGEEQTLPVPGFGDLGPSGKYTILGGLLSRYSRLRNYIVSHPNYTRTDGEDLGFYPITPKPDETQLKSHVTPHRDHFKTTLNCTKPGDADTLGVEYRIGQEPDWHPLGAGIGTNAKWEHDYPSLPEPINLSYRITLYHRGHPTGQPTIVNTSSQP